MIKTDIIGIVVVRFARPKLFKRKADKRMIVIHKRKGGTQLLGEFGGGKRRRLLVDPCHYLLTGFVKVFRPVQIVAAVD